MKKEDWVPGTRVVYTDLGHIGTIAEIVSSDVCFVLFDGDSIKMSIPKSRLTKVETVGDIVIGSVTVVPSTKNKEDWRMWRHNAAGDCVCGIAKVMCIYHKE